ncbi:MMPL family transporter [Desulfobacula sp.]|uniref:efflux RND transporter permease subunit n=1 Tax=Desulfobacula sp. TaxID=2593537 RepID=UPI00262E3357|nr:MMPL family transporter [Desulfobacula sp.]
MGCTMILSLLLIVPASLVRIDASGVSFTTDAAENYTDYLAFVESFGTDDYVMLAIKNSLNISDPELEKRFKKIHQELSAMDTIIEVIDLGAMASSDFIKIISDSDFWDDKYLAKARQIIPGFGRLVSDDMKTLAVIVKINNENLNGFQLEKQLKHMKQILIMHFPEHPHCYATGIPVLRAAFERYNLESALIFGSIGLLFGSLIAFYLFKTPWTAVMVMLTSLISLVWILGIMGIFGIDLNLATSLSFGFILVVSTTTVFHIVSAYFQLLKIEPTGRALVKTFQTVLRPCFMCSLTTSTGFLGLTMSPVPMVRQAGIIISMGVMLAFFLTLVTTAFFLPKLLNFKKFNFFKTNEDFLDRFVKHCLITGFNKPALSVWLGIAFIITMAWAIPDIQMVKHLTTSTIKNTTEAKDLAYIEQHISTGTSFSVILQSVDDNFKTRGFWYDLIQYEKNIKSIPGIQGVESLTPLVFRMALKFSPGGINPEKAFDYIQAQSRGNNILRSYYNPISKKIRIIVHIQSRTSDQVEIILGKVKKEAEQIFSKKAEVTLSGQLILLRSQTADLVSSQVRTLIFALFVITILMMIQLRSIVLGILSLIPNLFPLITIFGIMGWFHIPLDPLTIFAAVISFGLSVDDSIHYLTQLKREMRVPKAGRNIHDCLKKAYHKTSRALVSTTAVLFFSVLGLLFSSFSHVFSLGVLISSASIMALIGDLVFMPAIVLTFKPLNYLLSHKLREPVS